VKNNNLITEKKSEKKGIAMSNFSNNSCSILKTYLIGM